jgi:excinuclease ABC subunit C
MEPEELKNFAKSLPKKPGVYLMKNAGGKILYIGKASDLRSRVSSYFSKEATGRYQISFLMKKVKEIDTVVTDNAKEAVLLENTLIKKHRPRYNIDLKDDKSYVSLRLDLKHDAPRLYVTRRIRKDGSRYYGPYSSAGACREVVDFIERHFRLRNCSDHEYRNRVRPCLQYQIGRCDAPCVGLISLKKYREIVGQVRLYLEGKGQELKKIVTHEMKRAAVEERFEDAARYRDLITDMERTLEKQKMVSHRGETRDVIGYFREGESISIFVLKVRDGHLQGHASYFVKSLEEFEDWMASFLTQYYEAGREIPPEILLALSVPERSPLEEILTERAGYKVSLKVPKKGERLQLLKLAEKNAEQSLRHRQEKAVDTRAVLENLKRKLHLERLPERIECYDISHFQGGETRGSLVTFFQGRPEPKQYRQFKIKRVEGIDDFASLYEVVSRRVKRARELPRTSEEDPWSLPDLMIIDGGKGQLNAVASALRDQKVEGVDLISLAKKEEHVFLPGRKNPVILPRNSNELFLLIQARDEAHRFGIESHRKAQKRRSLLSGLDKVEGVGKLRRQRLLKHFGSLKRIKDAEVDQIVAVMGGGRELAQRVKDSL